jgi:hypothetical protein
MALLAIGAVWVLAIAGYTVVKNRKITADKVRAFEESVDLSRLSGTAREDAINKLAEMLNSLALEERRKARLDRLTWAWLNKMTEAEKASFLEATLPTGFKQMLAAFEQLPEDKRRKTISDALKNMQDTRARNGAPQTGTNAPGTNLPPVLSTELQAKLRTLGLKAFYSESSPQTRAELAPVLEEMQRVMESGRPFRGP